MQCICLVPYLIEEELTLALMNDFPTYQQPHRFKFFHFPLPPKKKKDSPYIKTCTGKSATTVPSKEKAMFYT